VTFNDGVGIFFRTAAVLGLAALGAVQGFDWASGDQISNNSYMLGLTLLAVLVGSSVAVGWAFVKSPATKPLDKALRAAVEKIVGGVGAVALNSWVDVVSLRNLLITLVIAAAFSFVGTLLAYVAPPATESVPG
jgi:hypothetical protein